MSDTSQTLPQSVDPDAVVQDPGRGMMITACAVILIDSIGLGVILPLFPFIILSFGAGPAVVTQLVAVAGAATFLASPWLGRLSDRLGRKPVVLASLAGSVAASLGMLLTWSLPGMFLFRALGGAMNGRDAVIQALVTDSQRGDLHIGRIGWLSSARGIGLSLGPVIGGALGVLTSSPKGHYRLVFILSIVLGFVALALAARFLPRPAAHHAGTARAARAPLSAFAPCLPPMIQSAVISYAFGIVLSVTAIFVNSMFGWTAVTTGWLLGLSAGTIALVRMGGAQKVGQILGLQNGLAASLVLAALALGALSLAKTPAVFLVGFFFLNLAYAIGLIIATGLVSTLAGGETRGQALGLNQAFTALASFSSASLSGLLFQFLDPHAPYAVGAVVVGAGLVALRFLPVVKSSSEASGPRSRKSPS